MHERFLLRALALAHTRRGFTSPNPSVGAVLVKKGKIISEGVHFAHGKPHAETEAILNNKNSKGAILYVSLEPCNHWGKTPPCTDLIISSRIKEVYFAYRDPNPLVSNKTIDLLKAANIPCHHMPLEVADTFYYNYQYWLKHKIPYVTAKLALSLDNKIAGSNSEPITITNAALKKYTHQCRQKSDILLTTQRTIIQDNPELNVRLSKNPIKKPLAVLASDGYLPDHLNIFKTTEKIILFHNETIDIPNKNPNITYYGVPRVTDGLDLFEVLKILGKLGYHDVWVEAGGKCFSAFLSNHLVNKAILYFGSIFLGSKSLSAFHHIEKFPAPLKTAWKIFDNNALCELYY